MRPKDHSHDQGDARLSVLATLHVHLQHLKPATCLVKANLKFFTSQQNVDSKIKSLSY